MSKTARGCFRAMRGKQHPAILPWLSCLSLRMGDRSPIPDAGSLKPPDVAIADASNGIRSQNARGLPRGDLSAANTQPLNQRLVTLLVASLDVIEQLAAMRHELQQPTS